MNQGMKSAQFQYHNYSPTEFEQFRAAVQSDGFTVTQNTIDTVSGHIGSLTYLTGFYNRNQQVLTVTVKTSPWQSLQDGDLKSNVNRVVAREVEAEAKVNPTPVQSPVTPAGTGVSIPPKAVVQPAVQVAVAKLTQTPAPAQAPKPAQASVSAQTPKPAEPAKVAEVAKPAEVATPTPTK